MTTRKIRRGMASGMSPPRSIHSDGSPSIACLSARCAFRAAARTCSGSASSATFARLNERDSWPLIRRDRTGIASQFGELTGIEGLATPRHLEIMPYAVTKNITTTTPTLEYGRQQQITGGADLKYGVTSNLTLDATANPDFGQVEADPAVLNLSAFETFFREKRPFFIEGTGIFRFDLQCHNGSCSSLFYSRRIGRTPQITDTSTTALLPTSTSIIGAAKLTGRTQNGLSVGVLDAVTDRESGSLHQTLEPRSNYFVGRMQQELGAGKGNVGIMLTGVNRQLDDFASDSLRRSAYTGGTRLPTRFPLAGLSNLRLLREEPGRRLCQEHRAHAGQQHALLSEAGGWRSVRYHAHVAQWRRRASGVRQGERPRSSSRRPSSATLPASRSTISAFSPRPGANRRAPSSASISPGPRRSIATCLCFSISATNGMPRALAARISRRTTRPSPLMRR